MKSQLHRASAGNAQSTATAEPAIEVTLRRRWFYLLPAVFVTYSLAYLDRANYGFGAAAGLAATLHITAKDSSLLSALFFLGYFAFQLPGAIFARKRSASGLVFTALIAWGMLAAMTGILRQFWLLALDRFLLGVAESCIFPAMLLLLTRWFTRAERSRANTILILGNPVTVIWMSAITGFLIQDFGWQKTFILEGIPSILWAFVWMLFVRNKPREASWMTPEAATVLEDRLSREQVSLPAIGAVRAALIRSDVLLLSAQYFLWSLGVYGFVLWLPTILRQGGALSMANTGLLSACPYVFAVLLMLLVAQISDKTLKRRSLIWPLLLTSAFALFGSFLFAQRSFPIAFACLIVGGGCMYAPYGPFFAIVPERVPKNVTAEVLAMINSCGALGGFFGSYFVGWLQAATGNPRAGYLLMSFSLACSAILFLFLVEPQQSDAVLVPEACQEL
ncbi:MAG TPA: MFS transporter [Acidobacteriaceae bacterium]